MYILSPCMQTQTLHFKRAAKHYIPLLIREPTVGNDNLAARYVQYVAHLLCPNVYDSDRT